MKVYETAGAVDEKTITTDLVCVSYKAQQIKNRQQAVSISVQHHTSLLKEGYRIVEAFVEPCRYHQRSVALCISRNDLIPQP